MELGSLLAQPVLRISRYEEQLQDLLKFTTKQHQFYNLLNRCHQLVRNLSTQIGSHKRKIEEWEQLSLLAQNLSQQDRRHLCLLREGRRVLGSFYVVRAGEGS